QKLGKLPVVAVAGLMELRPAVVVAPVHVCALLQEQPNKGQVAGHAEEVIAVRTALPYKPSVLVEERPQPLEIAVLDGAIREHERRRWLLAARERLHTACQLRPAGEPVPLREVAARVRERGAVHRRDSVRASLVILEIRMKRLLDDFMHKRRPAREPLLTREHELRARQARRQIAETRER